MCFAYINIFTGPGDLLAVIPIIDIWKFNSSTKEMAVFPECLEITLTMLLPSSCNHCKENLKDRSANRVWAPQQDPVKGFLTVEGGSKIKGEKKTHNGRGRTGRWYIANFESGRRDRESRSQVSGLTSGSRLYRLQKGSQPQHLCSWERHTRLLIHSMIR